ncbi:LysR family transcriptional regulator substrate-binding protein [Streptomyces nogalater]
MLPTVLGLWRRKHPGVRIRLFEHRRSDEMAQAMTAGQADVAVGPLPEDWEGTARHIGAEEFLVVTRSDDPVALSDRAPRVRLSDLAEREWVHFTPASGLSDVLDRACEAAGFRPGSRYVPNRPRRPSGTRRPDSAPHSCPPTPSRRISPAPSSVPIRPCADN